MIFLNPILAAGAIACVALPILIHILMRRRRRPVPWGAMQFLIAAYQRQRRRVRFEQLLLLALRCLLVLAAAIALGRPILDAYAGLEGTSPRTLYILLDNSLTSAAEREGAALEKSRQEAIAAVEALDPARGDRVAVISLASPVAGLIYPPSSDLASAKAAIERAQQADSRADLSTALKLIADDPTDESESRRRVLLCSELRAGSVDVSQTPPLLQSLSGTVVATSPIAEQSLDNLALARLEVLQPLVASSQDALASPPLPVRLTAIRSGAWASVAGESQVDIMLSPFAQSDARATPVRVIIPWSAGQTAATVLALVPTPTRDELLSHDTWICTAWQQPDSLPRDDAVWTPVQSRARLDICILSPNQPERGPVEVSQIDRYTAADWLSLSLAPQATSSQRRRLEADLRVSILNPANASQLGALSEADAIVLPRPDLLAADAWSLVSAASQRGAFVLLMPPAELQTHLWSDMAMSELGLPWRIAREPVTLQSPARLSPDRTGFTGPDPLALLAGELEELMKPVSVFRTLPLESGGGDALLRLESGEPILITTQGGQVTAGAPSAGVAPVEETSSSGIVAYLTVAPQLDWTDLPTKPLMLPLMQEVVRQGIGAGTGAAVLTAGGRMPLRKGAVELVEVARTPAPTSLSRTLPLATTMETAPSVAGLFRCVDGNGQYLSVIAINPDINASSVDRVDPAAIRRWLTQTGLTVESSSESAAPSRANEVPAVPSSEAMSPDSGSNQSLGVTLLIASLVIAASELVLARLFSHAKVDAQ